MNVRPARPEDARRIAEIQVETWRATYPGVKCAQGRLYERPTRASVAVVDAQSVEHLLRHPTLAGRRHVDRVELTETYGWEVEGERVDDSIPGASVPETRDRLSGLGRR